MTDRASSRPPRTAAGGPTAPARPAATVVLLRPGPAESGGPEVLLTLRPASMAFGGGLHVFPGGRIETADAEPRILARARAGDAARVAAARELFEEAGILLAEGPDGRSIEADERLVGALPRWRAALAGGEIALATILEEHDLTLATDRLVPIGRWQTPRAYPRRFDTRFFAVGLPAGAALDLDPHEVAGHAWLTPGAALAAMAAGTIQLWPPTSTTLQRLEGAADLASVRYDLELVEDLPFTRSDLGGGLVALTGGKAFGPAGRPANTILVGRQWIVVVDPGHAAGSVELQERTGAPILAGPGGGASLSWPVTEIGDGTAIVDGDIPLLAIATPGHRPDHLAFRLPDSTILAGDALTDRPTLVRPPQGDARAARATLERLAALDPIRIVPGHGPVLPDGEVAIERALAALARATPSD